MKATKQHFVVTIDGIPGTWSQSSGGAATAEVTRHRDGGAIKPDLLGSHPDHDDLELTRGYDPLADRTWTREVRRHVGNGRFTVNIQPTDINMIAIGEPDIYPDCLLIGMSPTETDANSGDPAEITLTLATTGPA